MIKYWITGVLDVAEPKNSGGKIKGEIIHKDMVWTGAFTKEMRPWKLSKVVGQARQRIEHMLPGIDLKPYGYTSRHHAQRALANLIARGEGFLPLKGVHSLEVVMVEYHSNGDFYPFRVTWSEH